MKISMVTRQFVDVSHGGVENHVLFLSRALQRLGHDVTVVRIGSTPPVFGHPEDIDLRWVKLGRSRGQQSGTTGRAGTGPEFLERLRSNAYSHAERGALEAELNGSDVVHFHDLTAIWRVAKSLAANHCSVWTNHLGEFLRLQELRGGGFILRMMTRPFSMAIAPSSQLAAQGAIACPVQLIPNGVEVASYPFTLTKEGAKARLGIPVGTKVVLVPRRWAPTKGVHLLALGLQTIELPGAKFFFVGAGSGSYGEYRLGVSEMLDLWRNDYEVIDMLPPEEMIDWYAAADLTVLPSIREAISLSALEAMAAGSTVVATPVGGLPEIVHDGVTGILATDATAEGVADAVMRGLSMDEDQSAGIRLRAREMVHREYSWDSIAERTVRVYESAIESTFLSGGTRAGYR